MVRTRGSSERVKICIVDENLPTHLTYTYAFQFEELCYKDLRKDFEILTSTLDVANSDSGVIKISKYLFLNIMIM